MGNAKPSDFQQESEIWKPIYNIAQTIKIDICNKSSEKLSVHKRYIGNHTAKLCFYIFSVSKTNCLLKIFTMLSSSVIAAYVHEALGANIISYEDIKFRRRKPRKK